MATTIVGAVKYDASIDLASLRSSVAQADKIVEQSYKKQSQNAQKSSKEITATSSKDAQTRVDAVKREAQETANTISKYTPQIQRQFLTVERANNQVTSATVRAQEAIQRYGSGSFQATKATESLSIAVQNQSQQQSRLQSMLDGTSGQTGRFSSAMAKAGAVAGATAAVVGTALAAALSTITGSLGNAVTRIDTLIAFPKVLEAMGVSANSAQTATKRLSESLKGLPTPLQDGAAAVQKFVSSGLEINKATRAFLGVNNALLATGANAQDTQVVMDSLQRVISAGSGDASTLQAILSRMPTVLSALSKESGKSQAELYKLFSEDPQALLDNIIRLNEVGGGGMASLEKQAREATNGIATSFSNFGNAVTRGIESIVTSIGSGDLERGQERISSVITRTGKAFESVLKTVAEIITFISSKGGAFINWVQESSTWITNLSIVIGSLLLPQIILIGKQSTLAFASYIKGLALAVANTVAASARMALAWLLALGPIGLIVAAVGAATALIIANWDSVSSFVGGVWQNIQQAASSTFEWIKTNWPLILAIITGPIGLATLAIIRNFDTIRQAVGNVWNWIQGVFGTIGSVAATIIKAPVNAIISFAERTLNGFIGAINGVINNINNIPGVNIGRLGGISVPRLAEGGIVQARPGGILANIGEGGKDEAVIPLDRLEKMMSGSTNNQNVTVNLSLNGVMTSSKSDERAIAERIAKLINEAVKAKTGKPAIAGI